MRVFLGGTTNGSKWRDEIIDKLEDDKIQFYKPLTTEWNEKSYTNNLHERKSCDLNIHCITPMQVGFYSIAEVVDDAHIRPTKTIFMILDKDQNHKFNAAQKNSLAATSALLLKLHVPTIHSFDELEKKLEVYKHSHNFH